MTEGRVTQAPVEVVERYDTVARVTQTPVEVVERYLTVARVTQVPVEVMWSVPGPCEDDDPDYLEPVLGPETNDLATGAAKTSAPISGQAFPGGSDVLVHEAPRAGSAISSAPRKGSARVG